MQSDDDIAAAPVGWRFGAFELYPAQRRMLYDGALVTVEGRALDLLVLLASRNQYELTRREVTEALWGNRPVSDTTLRQVLYKARRAVGDDGERQTIIRTLHGRSLQWVAPLEVLYASDTTGDSETKPTKVKPVLTVRKRWLPAAAAVVLSLTAMALWMNKASAPEDSPLLRVAIAPFVNDTNVEALDWTKHGLPGLLGTMLAQDGGGLDVLGTAQVARVWDAKPAQATEREARVRQTLGAQTLISGRLRKLTEDMYELTVRVTPHAGFRTQKITLTGAEPSLLAVNASRRIRGILLPQSKIPSDKPLPTDRFLAEAYARGMSLMVQGKMSQAGTLFELCVQNAPDFLPAQLQLGEVQIHTGKIDQARKTLSGLVDAAQKRADYSMLAQALNRLSGVEMYQQQFATALALVQRALPLATRSRDKKIQAVSALRIVNAASRLGKLELAGRELAQGRALIERNHLISLNPTLYNAEAFYAMARGDLAGREAADRASLRYSEATGNESNALSARYNVASDLSAQGRVTEAIPLLQNVFVDAKALHNTSLAWYSGYTLGAALLAGGVDQQALVLVDELLPIADPQKHATWRWATLTLRAAIESFRNDPKAALNTYRKAEELVVPEQAPLNAIQLLEYMARVAYAADPAALPQIARRADAIAATTKGVVGIAYAHNLLRAIVNAGSGWQKKAVKNLQAAAAASHPVDTQGYDFRGVAFILGTTNKAAAVIGKNGFDATACSDAPTLRLYAHLAHTSGDKDGQIRAEARIAALRKATLAALSSAVAT